MILCLFRIEVFINYRQGCLCLCARLSIYISRTTIHPRQRVAATVPPPAFESSQRRQLSTKHLRTGKKFREAVVQVDLVLLKECLKQ
jgi:hypothetical protein